MTIERTFIGSFGSNTGQFELNRFLEAGTIYDHVVFEGIDRLGGFIDAFGFDGALSIIDSGLVTFVVGAGCVGRADYLRYGFIEAKAKTMRPLSWFFETIYVSSSRDKTIRLGIKKIQQECGLCGIQTQRIQDRLSAKGRSIRWPEIPAVPGFRHDLAYNPKLVTDFIIDGLSDRLSADRVPDVFLHIEEYEENFFRVDTNLCDLMGVSDVDLHEILGSQVGNAIAVPLRFGVMEQMDAAVGMSADQVRYAQREMDLLSKLTLSADKGGVFSRLISLRDIPALPIGSRVDAEHFLRMRESDECMAFRDWLRSSGTMSDSEIVELSSGWRAKMRNFIQSPISRGIRWMTATGWSAVEPISGIALSAIDSFMIDRLLPKACPLAFIDDSYSDFIRESAHT